MTKACHPERIQMRIKNAEGTHVISLAAKFIITWHFLKVSPAWTGRRKAREGNSLI